eukprot:13722872-Alexandrium_andersonii.AAC.1
MRAVYAACVQKARACVKRPFRAVNSRLEKLARAAETAGQQRAGLAGERPRMPAGFRPPPPPGVASALPPEAELRPPPSLTEEEEKVLKGEAERAVLEWRRRALAREWDHVRHDIE